MEKTYLGMDLGATKLMIGEIDSKGNVLNYRRYTTGQLTQKDLIQIICESWHNYCDTVGFKGEPASLGIGMIGTVDTFNGIWYSSNISYEPVNMVHELYSEIKLPISIENDVRAATQAEMLLGHGKEVSNFIYYNIGTGIAAGFVINGKILRGAANNNGEVGHMVVDMNSKITCRCGRKGCVEMLASGYGLDCSARYYINKYDTSLLESYVKSEEPIPAQVIFDGAQSGDLLCNKLVEDASRAVAESMMNLIRALDPEMIVLGGGLASSQYYMDMIISCMSKHTLRNLKYGFTHSKFNGEFIGLIGAAVVGQLGIN